MSAEFAGIHYKNFTLSYLGNSYSKELSLYLFGKEKSWSGYNLYDLTDEQFLNYVSNYLAEDGRLNNCVIDFSKVTDTKYYALGVEGTNHAYSLKNVRL